MQTGIPLIEVLAPLLSGSEDDWLKLNLMAGPGPELPGGGEGLTFQQGRTILNLAAQFGASRLHAGDDSPKSLTENLEP